MFAFFNFREDWIDHDEKMRNIFYFLQNLGSKVDGKILKVKKYFLPNVQLIINGPLAGFENFF